MPQDPLRFGVVADPQFAPVAPNTDFGCYYGNSLWKLSEAIAVLDREDDLAFVVTLGDVIDRDWLSFSYILPLYDRLRTERFFLAGNHDFSVDPAYLDSVLRTLGLTSGYYEFARGGIRFVVVDGTDVSTFAPPVGDPRRALAAERIERLREAGAANAKPWNGSLSDAQFAWLGDKLQAASDAGERVIVLSHYPVNPPHRDNLLDSERLLCLVAKFPNVAAWFSGHNHDGNYGRIGNTHFVTFKGMVGTPTETAYAIVTVFADRIEIEGFGREDSRTLPLAALTSTSVSQGR